MAGPADRVALQGLIADMRGEYARKLPERLAHMELMWREIFAGDASRGMELLRAAHSIAGAAATFGFPEVGKAALDLELVLRPIYADGGARAEADTARIEDRIRHLLRAGAQPPS